MKLEEADRAFWTCKIPFQNVQPVNSVTGAKNKGFFFQFWREGSRSCNRTGNTVPGTQFSHKGGKTEVLKKCPYFYSQRVYPVKHNSQETLWNTSGRSEKSCCASFNWNGKWFLDVRKLR